MKRAIAPAVAVVLLALGLFGFPWRMAFAASDLAFHVSPVSIEACDATTCKDGEAFGYDLDHMLDVLDGDAFVRIMHAAKWTHILAILAELAFVLTAVFGARDRWLARLPVAAIAGAALVVDGVIAFGILRQDGSGAHTGPGLWLALAGALVGAVGPLVGSPVAAARVDQPRV
jgi:hypothetical protein